MPIPLPRRLLWLLAVLIAVTAALAVIVSVQAELEPVPVITPYDPLPRW